MNDYTSIGFPSSDSWEKNLKYKSTIYYPDRTEYNSHYEWVECGALCFLTNTTIVNNLGFVENETLSKDYSEKIPKKEWYVCPYCFKLLEGLNTCCNCYK